MAIILEDLSRTFGEYLIVPGYSSRECIPSNVSLKTPLTRYKKGDDSDPNSKPKISLSIPLVSAIMQSVSDDRLAIAIAKEGGMSFIFGSQTAENQVAMVSRVKNHKSGFVKSDSNLAPNDTLADVLELLGKTGHSTMAVTENGTADSKLVGLVTSRDYRVSRASTSDKVSGFMTPLDHLITAPEDTTLSAANDILWEHKLNQLPILDNDGRLKYFVFRKDYNDHKENTKELLDSKKRYMVGAGINTRDYETRVPMLIEAGVDALCIDSSEGFSQWQADTIKWIKDRYDVPIGAGNIIDGEGFRFLAESGADFIKVGIGGGAICITREQKGIGRGQASAVLDVAAERDLYFEQTGIYVPICSDGGIVHDYHMTLALAMGADFMMLGRYFARFDESPTNKLFYRGKYVKEYWGEGSNRARNWMRYDESGSNSGTLKFEEGVDSYVPYAGGLKENVDKSLAKVISTMCNCGTLNLPELRKKAKLVRVSPVSLVEGGAHDVILKEMDNN